MINYDAILISIYAQHDVAAVRSNPQLIVAALAKSVEELSRDSQFARAKDFVETQKLYIEGRREELETPNAQTQVGECLKLLLRIALFPNEARALFERTMTVLKDLLFAMFAEAWSESQRAHYEYMFDNMLVWKSYFLSYTNRSSRASNERYEKVIMRAPAALRKDRSWDDDNLLADVIVDQLSVRNVQRCFYDKHSIDTGETLKPKIRAALDHTFAFIQLVQTETFTASHDNWSFLEWEVFDEVSKSKLAGRNYFTDVFKNRFAAILTREKPDLLPGVIPPHYDAWRDLIFSDKRYLELPTDPDKFVSTMQSLTARIVNLQHEIIATVPA